MPSSERFRYPLTRNLLKKYHLEQSYLDQLPGELLDNFSLSQLRAINLLLERGIQNQASGPKIVDLNFTIDLILTRFYVTLFVGKDRRTTHRKKVVSGITRIGNRVAAVVLLLSLNLFVSSTLFLLLYLIKSALGIDLLPGHFGETIR